MTGIKHQKSLKTISFLSNWMDTKFKIPGTDIRFGVDALLSLIPGIGDIVSTGISLSIFGLILSKGVPFFSAIKMMTNILIDSFFSAIPILGTIVDIGFKANTKNLALLETHLKNNPEGKYYNGIWAVFGLTIVLALLILFVIAVLIWKLVSNIF